MQFQSSHGYKNADGTTVVGQLFVPLVHIHVHSKADKTIVLMSLKVA